MTSDESLSVKIFSPYKTFYEGPAVSLSAINDTGPFDVLVGHINFFTILAAGDVVANTGDEAFTFPITHGIMHVRWNRVTLFVFGLNE